MLTCPAATARAGAPAERAAGGQLVGVAAAERVADLAAAQQPVHVGAGVAARRARRTRPARSARSARCRRRRSACPRTGPVRPGRSGPAPGRRIRSRGGVARPARAGRPPPSGFGSVQVPEASITARRGSAAHPSAVRTRTVSGSVAAGGVDDPVTSAPGDADHPRAVPDPVAEHVGERLQVPLRPLRAGRVGLRVRRLPSGRGEQLLRGRVDELAPPGEQPHVVPLPHRRPGGGTRFEDQRGQSRARPGAPPRPARPARHRSRRPAARPCPTRSRCPPSIDVDPCGGTVSTAID